MTAGPDAGRADPFLWLFALAWAGGAIAYVPLLTILLPLRIVAMSGDNSVRVLGIITFFGAIAASSGSILFGWLSDLTRKRRPWILAGLILSQTILVSIPLATSPWAILALIICWQLALNMLLGPLGAWAADQDGTAERDGLRDAIAQWFQPRPLTSATR